jgi:pyruvate formate lyase activating enzyme
MTTIEPGANGHPARWWHPGNGAPTCLLCPQRCRISEGKTGFCNSRANFSGEIRSLTYGRVCVTAVDPIEKKPVFHFHPGAKLFSVGTFGCNLDCAFCQNEVLARSHSTDVPSKYLAPEDLVQMATEKKVDGIGWTFNDPVVWSEYIIDVSRLANARGLFTLLNTNGYIEKEAREDLLENVDAVKVDIKGFDEQIYHELCRAKLGPVLDTCSSIKERGIHLELAYPVIPGRTDDPRMMAKFADWAVAELGRDTPVHLFRFQPAYRLKDLRSLDMDELLKRKRILTEAGLRYVYMGGVIGEDQDTRCPACGVVVISRRAEEANEKVFVKKEQVSRFCPTFANVEVFTRNGCCPHCGESLPFREIKPSG